MEEAPSRLFCRDEHRAVDGGEIPETCSRLDEEKAIWVGALLALETITELVSCVPDGGWLGGEDPVLA